MLFQHSLPDAEVILRHAPRTNGVILCVRMTQRDSRNRLPNRKDENQGKILQVARR
jgi:hypothetical protein